MTRAIFLLAFAFQLVACASLPPLPPVQYEGSVSVKSNLSATLIANTGVTTGYAQDMLVQAGGIFVPIRVGPVPELQFGEADQTSLIASLGSELRRLGVVGSLADNGQTSIVVVVNFVHTEHFPQMQQYKISASMELASADLRQSARYEVLSSEGDSIWTKMGTNAAQGKEKVAKKLMQRLIPDIEAFVARVVKHESEKGLNTL